MADASRKFPTVVTGFGYAPLGPALWLVDDATGLKVRDLSLDQASDGALSGRHLRSGGFAIRTDRLIAADAGFVFLFILAGTVTITQADGEAIILEPLMSVTRHGTGGPATVGLSHDAEIVEMSATSDDPALFGCGDGRWTVTEDGEEAYVQGEGPRGYFRYRDLGVAAATDRRIHIHVVRSTKAISGGTGWHSHSMGQLFYVLRGWADLAVERQPAVKMVAGDAMCIAKGMKHNVPAFSEDYLVLEMCIPADYSTDAH